MKRTEVAPLKFSSELDKVWPGGRTLQVLTGEHIDKLVSTLGKILSNAHPSYIKILTLLITYFVHYGNVKDVFYNRKVYYMNKIHTKLRHSLPSICEIEINRKNINPSAANPK